VALSFKYFPKISYFGDKKGAKQLWRLGLLEYYKLRSLMKFQNLAQHDRITKFSDGTIIKCFHSFNAGFVEIFVPVVEEVSTRRFIELELYPYLMYVIEIAYYDPGDPIDQTGHIYVVSMLDLKTMTKVEGYLDNNGEEVKFPAVFSTPIWHNENYLRVLGAGLLEHASLGEYPWNFVSESYESPGFSEGNGVKYSNQYFEYMGANARQYGNGFDYEAIATEDNDLSAVECCAAPALDCVGDVRDGYYDSEVYDTHDQKQWMGHIYRSNLPTEELCGISGWKNYESEGWTDVSGEILVEIWGTCYYPYFPFEYDEYQVVSTEKITTSGESADTFYVLEVPLGEVITVSTYTRASSYRRVWNGLAVDDPVDYFEQDTDRVYKHPLFPHPHDPVLVETRGALYFEDNVSALAASGTSPLNCVLQLYKVESMMFRNFIRHKEEVDGEVTVDDVTITENVTDSIIVAGINNGINLRTFSIYSQLRNSKLEAFFTELIEYGISLIPPSLELDPWDIEVKLGYDQSRAQIMIEKTKLIEL